jgi:hypothetical protein
MRAILLIEKEKSSNRIKNLLPAETDLSFPFHAPTANEPTSFPRKPMKG